MCMPKWVKIKARVYCAKCDTELQKPGQRCPKCKSTKYYLEEDNLVMNVRRWFKNKFRR